MLDPARARRHQNEWAIDKAGRIWGDGMSPKVLWNVVRAAAALGCKQKLRCAVNDRLGIEPDAAA